MKNCSQCRIKLRKRYIPGTTGWINGCAHRFSQIDRYVLFRLPSIRARGPGTPPIATYPPLPAPRGSFIGFSLKTMPLRSRHLDRNDVPCTRQNCGSIVLVDTVFQRPMMPIFARCKFITRRRCTCRQVMCDTLSENGNVLQPNTFNTGFCLLHFCTLFCFFVRFL